MQMFLSEMDAYPVNGERSGTLRDHVFDRLRAAIITGELAPGLFLKEGALARSFGVSPTPIREALIELAAEGLILIQPNKRKQVAPIDFGEIVELFEVQNILWGAAIARAIPRLDAAEKRRLRDELRDFDRHIRFRETVPSLISTQRFLDLVLRASGNMELYRMTFLRLALVNRFMMVAFPVGEPHPWIGKFRSLGEAVLEGDTERAMTVQGEFHAIMMDTARAMAAASKQ